MYHHGSPPTRDPTLCITLGCHLGATLCVIIIKAYHSLAYHGNIIMFLGVFVTLKQPIYWQLSNYLKLDCYSHYVAKVLGCGVNRA